MNPSEPELPSDVEATVRRIAADDPLQPHPAAATLGTFDEQPEALSPGTRRWIEAHLRTCTACADALRAVPRLELPTRRSRVRPWPLAAAAGWILAVFLGLRQLAREPERVRDPFLSVHSLVLSATRDGEVPTVPADARVLRLALVLPEDVPLGANLRIRIDDEHGNTVVDGTRVVEERNERDWPVLTLERSLLPAGEAELHVRTPSGAESVFALRL